MPCLFLRNVPAPSEPFDPAATAELYQEFADAAGVAVEKVEIHIESTQYRFLTPDGKLLFSGQHGVHGFIEWHGGRSLGAKQRIAAAIHDFLTVHGIGEGSDIAFRDFPAETFFCEGKLVPGGPLRV